MPAAETQGFTFADIFAGIGGFHAVLGHAGGRCVYVSELDNSALEVYRRNWIDNVPESEQPRINTDITLDTADGSPVNLPKHDVLAAGFPCQPFSKSGAQKGMAETRGTLFWNLARIIDEQRPPLIFLENVRNLAGPRHAHEWRVIIGTLRDLGYRVSETPTVFSPHLLPPHLGGAPQTRERVYILGTYIGVDQVRAEEPSRVGPTVSRAAVEGWAPDDWSIQWVLDDDQEVDLTKYALSPAEEEWLDTWDDFVRRFRASRARRLPGFPLWSDFWHTGLDSDPAVVNMPPWKRDFIARNVSFYVDNRNLIDAWRRAHPALASFPASRRKLEWQAQDLASLWEGAIQLRPSGIRVKPPSYFPALVAMAQTSIIGPRRRRLTPTEGARLQGLPASFSFGPQDDKLSYKQLGNGIAVGAAWHVFREHVLRDRADLPARIVQAVELAPRVPPIEFTEELGNMGSALV